MVGLSRADRFYDLNEFVAGSTLNLSALTPEGCLELLSSCSTEPRNGFELNASRVLEAVLESGIDVRMQMLRILFESVPLSVRQRNLVAMICPAQEYWLRERVLFHIREIELHMSAVVAVECEAPRILYRMLEEHAECIEKMSAAQLESISLCIRRMLQKRLHSLSHMLLVAKFIEALHGFAHDSLSCAEVYSLVVNHSKFADVLLNDVVGV